MSSRRSAISAASRGGCGAIPKCAEFIEWLRAYNDSLSAGAGKTGFYGLDLYSLHASMKAVQEYLERVDPEAARRARARYACFDHFGPDPQIYGFIAATDTADRAGTRWSPSSSRCAPGHRICAHATAASAEDELFYAEQNARLVKNAEELLPLDVFRGRVVVEPARQAHGRDAGCLIGASRSPGWAGEDCRLGA